VKGTTKKKFPALCAGSVPSTFAPDRCPPLSNLFRRHCVSTFSTGICDNLWRVCNPCNRLYSITPITLYPGLNRGYCIFGYILAYVTSYPVFIQAIQTGRLTQPGRPSVDRYNKNCMAMASVTAGEETTSSAKWCALAAAGTAGVLD